MKLRSTGLMLSISAILLAGHAAAQSKPQMAEDVFKNVQVLKGITSDDFVGSMGVMSASLGFCCNDCHTGAGTDKVNWAADDNPKKVIARRMVTMVKTINKDNFGNRVNVTCWTCHRQRDRPATTPTLAQVYGPAVTDPDDVLQQGAGQPLATAILDKYTQALGGDLNLAKVRSYVGIGTSVGFGGLGGGGDVHLYAKFPDERTTLIEFKDDPGRGDSVRTYNGKVGWVKTPLTILGEYEVTGSELDGARTDALLDFPGQIKQALTDLRVGYPTTISDLPGPSSQTKTAVAEGIGQDREVNVVQGAGPRGILVTLYFDKTTNLLLRMVRSPRTPIGRAPTQIDFADYRDVGGVKFPFRLLFAWLDGRDAIQLKEIQLNVPIPDSKFGRPAMVKGQ